ncbi:MAG TPA: hypothetical protein VH854_13320 [Thermoanaerobaculia bacterium]|jgi:hypothetical protein|nr:hypothetical protein [Thermoanaerobaculia bacterium]
MKKPPVAVILLAASLSSLAVPSTSFACVVTTTLWDQVHDADLVVVARIVRIERPDAEVRDEDWMSRESVLVQVIDSWKGEAPASEVRISFIGGPPRWYTEGRTVLLFLERGDLMTARWRAAEAQAEETPAAANSGAENDVIESGETEDVVVETTSSWTAEERARAAVELEAEERRFADWASGRWIDAGIYGDVLARTQDFNGLGELVRRAADMQANGRVSLADQRSWMVAAAANDAVHDDVVYGLLGMKDDLTNEELARLADIFVRHPAVGPSDIAMLELLRHYPGSEVDVTAASVIEAAVRIRPIPDWTTPIVVEALHRYGDDFSERIGRDDRDPAGRLIESQPGAGTIPTIWAVARRDLGIPEVPPASPPGRPAPPPTD